MACHFTKVSDFAFDVAVQKVTDEPVKEGFGRRAHRVDVAAKLKKKAIVGRA